MKIEKRKIKRILIIKLKGIGDVILSTVALSNLKKEFPEATIDFLTERPSLPALEHLDILNEIIIFQKEKGLKNLLFLNNIRRRKYDLVIDFYSNPRTALITRLSGAQYRAGFPYRGRKYAYNLFGPSERDKYHAAELHLEFLKKLGISCSNQNMHFGLTIEDHTFANEFISENFSSKEFVIGLSPSGGWPSKKCDPEKFAEIGDTVADKYGAGILLLWGPGDQDDAIIISKKMKNTVILAPPTDIRKMGALMMKCAFIIANDSGPMHMATALNVPVLSLHGPTDPKLQGPFGSIHEYLRIENLDCIGCNLLECSREHECFIQLTPELILEKTDKLIVKNNIKMLINEKN